MVDTEVDDADDKREGQARRQARRALSVDGDAAKKAAEWATKQDSRDRTRQ